MVLRYCRLDKLNKIYKWGGEVKKKKVITWDVVAAVNSQKPECECIEGMMKKRVLNKNSEKKRKNLTQQVEVTNNYLQIRRKKYYT